ncbi:Asp-tRNA(Asn)/Glu-tRNA(Gln) amidotransferase subunit GatA [Phaeodactylibacter sp.]|uniref:Asp-tRNA(Asn)/Glu-tRNA(Gln) amidotransferase subunit GatA n=1 Tax=Phaeodactylibacter sp. TaxID=1940289 RepID=UPI0025DDCB04|nr:Asp-tRNA(Asn)/Glu-tRNA(Gln) amidotransferase subunit GatA [Phaeodactylibacter sp.]MCI4650435.1 Asp-tRNA(Asn)/Glu-tRNA(Gln) amidotransferase subunit GatA [Phaeodactylibacter sp.]MCI5093851.1 Asp-tRNA(Asn)/Glu-tRNA(Gln) amidotransferase subunit GatA [Phaeodactylibacter sp.]
MPKFTQLSQVRTAIEDGDLTCTQLVEYYLNQIEQQTHLNIYVEVYAQEALERARTLDARYQQSPGELGRLYGMVLSHKDVICYAGHGVQAGSKILEGFESLYSATAIERLLAEDAIIIGRVNCDEFAMGSSNETSHFGPVRNAADPERVPGGSSGGSAVAVQADTCLASLGSDTGGSVRQPASFCGVIGMKPTYGRISRHGLLAYGSSFDQIGTLTHSVEDAALLLEVMAGPDEFDSTASQKPVPLAEKIKSAASGKRIAYFPSALQHESIQPEVRATAQSFIEQLQEEGHTVEGVEFDLLDYLIPAYYVLTTAEASSNLSRYDGIRYGYRSQNATDLLSTYQQSRTEGFGTEVKRRIMLGTFVLSAGYYDAYYTKAQKVRRLLKEKTDAIFRDYDFIMMPAAPTTAWKLGDKSADPVEMYLADIFTVQANMAGIPAICIPVGSDDEGLPIGMQLMGPKFAEAALLSLASTLIR